MNEIKNVVIKVPQEILDLVNQIFEIEKKASCIVESNSIQRNVNRLKDLIASDLFKGSGGLIGFNYYNPLGEKYDETRTDCDASIAGSSVENLEIVEVIKPIVYYSSQENSNVVKTIVQKAVVVVESKN